MSEPVDGHQVIETKAPCGHAKAHYCVTCTLASGENVYHCGECRDRERLAERAIKPQRP